MRESGTCGTCHTLVTHALNPDGTENGVRFDEQVTFVEHNAANESRTCQFCHMPARDAEGVNISTRIARQPDGTDFPGLGLRTPFGRHVFVGGNKLVLSILRDEPLLGADAPREAFDQAIGEVDVLLSKAAAIGVGSIRVEGPLTTVPITVRALTGHKLPTGYPSRRVVLHVRATAANGSVVFESGGMDALGRILDSQGQPLPCDVLDGTLAPHLDVVDSEDEAQIWEEVPGDEEGHPTALLLRSNTLLKDNRLLPDGFDPTSADGQRAAPKGTEGDSDFSGNGDTVDITINNGAFGGPVPVQLEVRLLYQTLQPRWREGLAATGTPWSDALEEMLSRQDLAPSVLASLIVPL
jgi:hypothetical protein